MTLSNRISIALGFILFCLIGCNIVGSNGQNNISEFSSKEPVGFNISDLQYVKNQLAKGDTTFEKAYNNLLVEANKALNSYGYSVVTKEGRAPNGNKHEYVSRGRYWWPNPDTENGLPYIKKDGQTNPEIYQFDRISLSNLRNDIRHLSLAYYFSDDERYAKKAVNLIKQWFIDSETKMNPNLKYAQGIPGKTTGRPAGLIEGVDFYRILNFIPFLIKSNHWNKSLTSDLLSWYYRFSSWMLEHKYGEAERETPNNHGSWYDVQIITYAYFLGYNKKVDKILNRVKTKRIPEQIDPNGKQPYEIYRTRSLHYSVYNLDALTILASVSTQKKENPLSTPNGTASQLWFYKSAESGNIERAIQYLEPYLVGNKTWQFEQIGEYNPCSAMPVLKRAYDYFNEKRYKESYYSILKDNPSCKESINFLLYPITR